MFLAEVIAIAVWRKPDRVAFKANVRLKRTFVPFSNGTFPFQMERSLFKWNVPFSNGTFASQRERSFSTGTFASQRGRSLPKGTVRFPKRTFAFQKERSLFKGNGMLRSFFFFFLFFFSLLHPKPLERSHAKLNLRKARIKERRIQRDFRKICASLNAIYSCSKRVIPHNTHFESHISTSRYPLWISL